MATNPWQSCDPWVEASEVIAAARCDVTDGDPLADQAAEDAGALLRLMAGGMIDGICTYAVRPVILRLGGWPSNRCTCSSGTPCAAAMYRLAPAVTEIISVTVDGETLVEGVDYRLVAEQYLLRLADTSTRARRHWPTGQRLDLPSTERGTFQVVYRAGVTIPPFAKDAAIELAAAMVRFRLRLDTTLDPAVATASAGGTSLSITPAAERLRATATAETFPAVVRFLERVNPGGKAHAGDGIYSFDQGFGLPVTVPD